MKKIYLAIPYSKMGTESSFRQATEASVAIINSGSNVFSPITHSHPMAELVGSELSITWEFWQAIDYQFIDWADELWVLIPEEGRIHVDNSTGVQAEIKYAIKNNKNVYYVKMFDGKISKVKESKTSV